MYGRIIQSISNFNWSNNGNSTWYHQACIFLKTINQYIILEKNVIEMIVQ